jgi:glycosyltransferase involved in cell wall biosynthesis
MTDITLVIPTMNEEKGIGKCMEAAQDAFDEMDMDGEIILSDSSEDRTPEIGREKGAKIVEPDKPGYGYAYRYAFKEADGDLIAMGDGDTTYDFRELPELIKKMREENADMVMGSRLDGDIKPGSMPKLHRHIGNPLLTKFLNKFYGAGVSDAHSGMRVIRQESLDQLDLKTDGMEFASEMIMEAGARDLKIVEKPIIYHEREGDATLHSFRDGWRHIKFMLLNAPSYILSYPGIALMMLGISLLTMSFIGLEPLGQQLGENTSIAGLLLFLVGYQAESLSVFTSVTSDPIKVPEGRINRFILDRFSFEKGLAVGGTLFAIGALYAIYLTYNWYSSGFTAVPHINQSIAAFTGIFTGIQTVFYSMFLSIILGEDQTG